ncbi:hypothetical protein I4U23_001578 [Adineta vaga]|nr:hypothetical protein I4U23_001578 [Adineta vaga]
MPNRHADEDIQITTTQNSDSGIRRYNSHSHLNPTNMLDHIKTKVRRKCTSNKNPSDAITITVDDTSIESNTNSIDSKINEEQNFLKPPNTGLTKARSQPNISLEILTDDDFNTRDEDKNNNKKHLSNENITIVSDQFDKDEDSSPTHPREKLQTKSLDTEKQKKKTKSKSRKESKVASELVNESDTKKKREKTRRTVKSSSKTQERNKTKEDKLDKMETLPYLAGFQVRDDDFKHIFDELPSDEQLIVSYPCIWRKDMFMHGRMFLSMNYLCFYTCFFKSEERIYIVLKDIVSVERDKSANTLSNAIKLQTNKDDEYVFASFVPRERIFIAIFRLWQNALLEDPLDYEEIRTSIFADQLSGDESNDESEQSIRLLNQTKNSLESPQSEIISSKRSSQSSPMFTLADDTEQINYISKCPCESHLSRLIIDKTLPCHVDKLYELIFEDNVFSRAHRDSQKLTDFTMDEWRMNNDIGKQIRNVTYKTITQSILGTNTISCNEKQIMDTEVPHSLYVINTEVHNEGVKYTDAFFVATRYCMFQRNAKHSHLKITAEIKYLKSVNLVVKSFIEKNCHASIDEGLNSLGKKNKGFKQ